MGAEPVGPVWTIVVAAGSGTRFGAPKQFLALDGVRVIDRAVATAARHSDGVVVVVPSAPVDEQPPVAVPVGTEVRTVPGGATRAGSVRAGLDAVPDDAAVILVHDGARPLAGDDVYERVIEAVRAGADAVCPVVELADSLRRLSGGTVDRSEVVAVQTPQGFAAPALRSAHAHGIEATDDVSVVEADGGTVRVVDGDRRNLKITTPLDLAIARALLTGMDPA